ncbi:HAD family hydrolase [Candidatus Gottesmanbacteria bacterium]|nr:HAD family hydrolase [Candidatus Gottesmanbacteria bacterium]
MIKRRYRKTPDCLKSELYRVNNSVARFLTKYRTSFIFIGAISPIMVPFTCLFTNNKMAQIAMDLIRNGKIPTLPKKIKLLIWDLDETLYYSDQTIHQVKNEYIHAYVQSSYDKTRALNKFIALEKAGNKWFDIVASMSKQIPRTIIQSIEDTIDKSKYIHPNPYVARYFKTSTNNHVILTNSTRTSAIRILHKLGIHKSHILFKSIYTIEDFHYPKPNIDILQHIIYKYQFQSNHIMCIGDSYNDDLLPAKQLGMITCHINHTMELQPADYTFSDLNTLLNTLITNHI